MSSDSPEAATLTEADGPEAMSAGEPMDHEDSREGFQAALEAEVARRIEAVERRWQSRKDRELNRARRRWESEAGQAIDPELLAWIAQADPHEVGDWLKAGLTTGQASEAPELDAASNETSDAAAESDEETENSQPISEDAGSDAVAEEVGDEADEPDDAGETEAASPAPDLEREAEARERLAEQRTLDPSPDLFPSRGAPADAFQQIEAGFARGEVDLETYETARRRRGLT